ncbi:hypothetical protein CEPID_02110 [Corynebacterium epidermidicanis]|uniref:Uncharacterized protein n=1 Tax=Corynebacterium epidermidicanis TaxID=1050174 RepID=A0A0G3GRY8_9CORY|nr:hypothetical protein CEPID_02110 [Corynebacterium epidermidicanis]
MRTPLVAKILTRLSGSIQTIQRVTTLLDAAMETYVDGKVAERTGVRREDVLKYHIAIPAESKTISFRLNFYRDDHS